MAKDDIYNNRGRPVNPFAPGYGGFGYQGGYQNRYNRGGYSQNPYSKRHIGTPALLPSVLQYQQDVKNAKLQEDTQSNDEINSWVESMTDIMGNVNKSLAKVPPNMHKQFAGDFRAEYNHITEIMRQIDGKDPDDPDRLAGLFEIEQMKSKWLNTNEQLEKFLKSKVNFVQAQRTGSMSDYYKENPDDKSMFAKIFTDNVLYSRDEQGNISFNLSYNKPLFDGTSTLVEKYQTLNDMPDLILKDFSYAEANLNTIESLTKAGQPLSEVNENLYRQKLHQEFSNPARLKSWLTDDFIIPGGFGIDESLLNDPTKFDELRDIAVDQTLELYKNAAQKGYDHKVALLKLKNNPSTTTPVAWHADFDKYTTEALNTYLNDTTKTPTPEDWRRASVGSWWTVKYPFKQIAVTADTCVTCEEMKKPVSEGGGSYNPKQYKKEWVEDQENVQLQPANQNGRLSFDTIDSMSVTFKKDDIAGISKHLKTNPTE